MQSVEARVIARLRGFTAITSLVGTQVYGGNVPQGTEPPYIVVRKISGRTLNTLSGPNASHDKESRLQIDVIANKYATVKSLASLIGDPENGSGPPALNGWRDDGARISSCQLDNEQDDTDLPEDESNVVGHRVVQDYIVWYQ